MENNEPSAATSSEPESSGDTLQIRIRTLDSSTHTLRVEKNIPVPALKEQLAALVGVPPQDQRLIYRGRVLKDDQMLSAYNVDDGHTLHLVPRSVGDAQGREPSSQVQTQAQNDAAGNQPGRPAQVTHSLLLGTINIPNAGDGALPDFNRIVSAVLGSVGNGAAVNLQQGTNPQQQRQGSVSLGGNHFIPRNFEIPSDALSTMSVYLSRMEQMFAMSGYGAPTTGQSTPVASTQAQSSSSALVEASAPGPNPAANMRALMTPAALGALIRRVQELLTNQAASALSGLAGQLESEHSTVDVPTRAEVQVGALWSANVMQQLGALLLELGRSTSMLHLGYVPAEAVVNAGPAVYISQTGPNPIMVQPSAIQSVGGFIPRVPQFQNAPRSLNIHIHTSDVGAAPNGPSSNAPAEGQTATPGTAGEASQSIQGSAVVQETIMIIQDNGEAHVTSSQQQPTPTAAAGGNSSAPQPPSQAHVAQVLDRLFPGGLPASFTVGAAPLTSSSHQSSQGSPAVPSSSISTAPPPPPSASQSLAASQPVQGTEAATANVSSGAKNSGSSDDSQVNNTPVGLTPLLTRPRRRTNVPRHPYTTQSSQQSQAASGENNPVASLMGQLMRSPAFANMAGSNSSGEQNIDVGRLLQQALPLVSQLLGSGAGAPRSQLPMASTNPSLEDAANPPREDEPANREKVESALKQLESGEPPQSVLRSVAEAAAENASVDLGDGEVSEILQSLSEDYASLLLQDLNARMGTSGTQSQS